ncbi:MAG: DUF1501 domain-containing protein [Acidimicrobiales bacterium]
MNTTSKKFSRRGVIGMLGAGAAGVASYGMWSLSDRHSSFIDDAEAAARDRPVRDHTPVIAGDKAGRTLVMIELEGGHDWVSTLVPYRDPALRSLRDATLPDMDSLIRLDDRYAINANLASTGTGMAFLHGVGTPNPTGSHFEMAARWRTGDAAGTTLAATGFLGRLCDELDQGAPVTGVSLDGNNPAILSRKSVTLGLPDGGDLEWLVSVEPWFRNLRSGIEGLGTTAADDSATVGVARTNMGKALRFSALLEGLEAEATGYPGGQLSDQLAIAAKLLGSNTGVRVILVSLGGFDTHTGQRGAHDALLDQIDRSVAAFQSDLERRGLTGSTLVATMSEFGRRPLENGSGTDHGSASTALLWGPVKPGVHGDALSLTNLDEDDNFVATMMMDEYYATLAEKWFGVDANDVLATKAKPVDGLVND